MQATAQATVQAEKEPAPDQEQEPTPDQEQEPTPNQEREPTPNQEQEPTAEQVGCLKNQVMPAKGEPSRQPPESRGAGGKLTTEMTASTKVVV